MVMLNQSSWVNIYNMLIKERHDIILFDTRYCVTKDNGTSSYYNAFFIYPNKNNNYHYFIIYKSFFTYKLIIVDNSPSIKDNIKENITEHYTNKQLKDLYKKIKKFHKNQIRLNEIEYKSKCLQKLDSYVMKNYGTTTESL